ncbi:MAG: phosphoribosyl-AMP cyclohydrolase [Omnitrophica WOR_2 bacterium RIFCSPHIGHO2_02_FULL_68_15]|nr:MAG: phosphoribosyl-AMP cyclohydrolase [Omnitrophica WOR_2 bacterium RIFCSPHIGHO2_02_FULL_68_15]
MTNETLPAFDQHELIPAIIQDDANGQVLMVAYMNREAFQKTLTTGHTHFYSRSRKKLWKKGEESGHVQEVRSVAVDCDGDAILVKVTQRGGGACHAGYRTCFYRTSSDGAAWKVSEPQLFDPKAVYGQPKTS